MSNNKKKVLVVGAGAGGLASAVLLQNSGFQVTLLDKNERIGGKLNRELHEGYVFDTGPSILTLPNVIGEIFAKTGADMNDYLELVNLDPQWRCFFGDGSHFDFRSGEEAMLQEVSQFAPEDVDGFRKLMLKAREMYRISEDNFFFKDLSNVWDVIKTGNASSLESLKLVMSIEPTKTYSDIVERYISNPKLKQGLEHLTQYIGSSPFMSPAILACLIHVQFDKGCWYPMGGMNKISEALAKRFEELGGEVELNTEITECYMDGQTVRGFESANGKLWTADEYVVNMDRNSFFDKVSQKAVTPEKGLACSGVTVFLGLKKRVENLAHHNFFFSESHEEEFKDIYERGLPHQDPTIYACVPTLTDSSVAPDDRENVFLLIHAPVDNGLTNWDSYLPEYVNVIESKLSRMGFDIASHDVEFRKPRSPKGIGEKWGTYKGNIYGVASHGRLAGGFKDGNASREFKNLQFAGGTVNPGAGVPMSLMSGMIAGGNLISKSESFQNVRL
jgi:phytoene desaturase